MIAKQTTVFIENRKGRLKEVLDVLKKNGVNILSLSLADTAEYGLLRIISNNPAQAKEGLSKAGFSSMLTDVFILQIPHTPGALQDIFKRDRGRRTERRIYVRFIGGRRRSVYRCKNVRFAKSGKRV